VTPRVFVLDDDPAMVEAVMAVLVHDGFEVDGTSDSAAFLRTVLRTPPDLVVLDVNMPGLSGWEICDILRRQPVTAELPVLFLTGRGEVADRITSMQVGGTDHLTKPFRAEDLRARARALTGRAAAKGVR
jgi:DNA-binding response OmpR family regulator